jgi:tetratricopeptide (TPR) repeat protein
VPNELEQHLAEKTAGLDPDARRVVYARAREALQNEVRASAPFMPVQTVVTRRRELENAIMAVERVASKGEPVRPVTLPPKAEAVVATPEVAAETETDKEMAEEVVVAANSEETVAEPASAEKPEEDILTETPPLPREVVRLLNPNGGEGDAPVEIRDVSLASYELLAKALEDISGEGKNKPESIAEHVHDFDADELVVERRRPLILYLGVLALVLCAVALAVLLVGFGFEQVQESAPVRASKPAAPAALPPPPSPQAELLRGAGFQGAAKDALTQANALLAKRDFPRAIAAFDDAIRLDSTSAAALAGRAHAHWSSGNVDAAIRDYGAAIDRDPKDAAHRLNRAIAYNRKGDYKLAADDLDRALAIGPPSAEALNSRCWARAVLSHLEEALTDCSRALSLRPDDPDALDSRGFVYLRLGRLDRAIADYDGALKAKPKLASSLYGRGLARIGRGDRAGGLDDVTAARAIDPDIVAAFARYGVR